MFLSKLFTKQRLSEEEQMRTAIYRNLLKREAAVGGTLFGPLPEGTKREFFCLDQTTWIWHEEWTDKNGRKQIKNTRYDIRPNGILKTQNGQGYRMASLDESLRLQEAIALYLQAVKTNIYAKYMPL